MPKDSEDSADQFDWTSTSGDSSNSEEDTMKTKTITESSSLKHHKKVKDRNSSISLSEDITEVSQTNGLHEVDSEPETRTKKKKKKKHKVDIEENGADHLSDEDSWLEAKVKQEKHKSKKKKNKKLNEDIVSEDGHHSETKEHSEEDSLLNVKVKKEQSDSEKPKKRKRSVSSDQYSDNTEISIKREHKKKKIRTSHTDYSEDDGYLERQVKTEAGQDSDGKKDKHDSDSESSHSSIDLPNGKAQSPNSVDGNTSLSESDSNGKSNTSSKRKGSPAKQWKTKSVDRIVFEDSDNDVKPQAGAGREARLDAFLRENVHLKPLPPLPPPDSGDFALSQDEDVWLLQCPTDVSVSEIKTIDLSIGNKPKFKLLGSTYEGAVDKDLSNVSIVHSENSKCVIHNISLMGVMRFHKRIPKIIAPQQEVSTTDNDFIPLPETKSRHPLFGNNYKAAMKMPKAVAQRLQGAAEAPEDAEEAEEADEADAPPRKAKKHKKKRQKAEAEAEAEAEPEAEAEEKPRSKRKRGGDAPAEQAPPHKRRKHAAWESEQAIEDSLFNF